MRIACVAGITLDLQLQKPGSLNAFPDFSELALSLPWFCRAVSSSRNTVAFLLSTPVYLGLLRRSGKHIKSLAPETLSLCARSRCRNTSTQIISLGQLLCSAFLFFYLTRTVEQAQFPSIKWKMLFFLWRKRVHLIPQPSIMYKRLRFLSSLNGSLK